MKAWGAFFRDKIAYSDAIFASRAARARPSLDRDRGNASGFMSHAEMYMRARAEHVWVERSR